MSSLVPISQLLSHLSPPISPLPLKLLLPYLLLSPVSVLEFMRAERPKERPTPHTCNATML